MKSITFGAEEQEGFLGYKNNVLADWKSICHLPCDLPIIEAGYIQPVHLCLKETDRDNRRSQTTCD